MRIGIDLGGSKIEIAALDAGGASLLRERMAAPQGNYDATVRAVRDIVTGAERRLGTRGTVGIGMPGAISPATGLVKNANSTWLNGRPFDRDMAAALGRPVRVANDANCFALSEAVDGAAAGARVVFGVIAGTGVGGGIAVDGHILEGPNAIAGEWGHNPLPWPRADELPGPQCYCGKTGCIETWLSGPGMRAAFARETGRTAEFGANAGMTEPAALAAFERYLDRFARALAGVVNILDPDVIVLGGGMSNIAALYDELPRRLGAHVFSDRIATPILKNRHGDSSGVRGAAWLWPAAAT